ncbi:MAG: hypothetical protein WBQ94_19505 [Terracidiphilus sp.]
MSLRQRKCLFLAVILLFTAGEAWPGDAGASAAMNLSSTQILERMALHNQEQNKELKQYKALRHYQVEYQGFPANTAAKMDVEVVYDASTGKNFRIVSESGTKFLCEKVLKRAVDSEKEASQDKSSTALTEANYRFHLAGTESVNGRPAYMIDVEPVKVSKFLYRGRIWVDGADFAVVKMETEPAKSPSFWISRTKIHYTNARTDSFWLPQHMRSETKVRIGGTAVMTIDYGTYQIGPKTE